MIQIPLSKTKLETKLAVVRASLAELEKMAKLSEQKFMEDTKNFAAAEHYLRRALEAVFDIAGHIISRYPFSPGNRPDTLKGLALALGEKGVVEKKFAEEKLVKMAGYRNRMVHFYDEVTAQELHAIIMSNLGDIEQFGREIAMLVERPEEFGLTIED